MKLLILGGTVFLGRHLVEAALAQEHEVTLFNRGKHNPDLFPEVEKLRGDRDGGLDALKGRQWDAAIDTCGYLPRIVKQSAELLADSVVHYTFISSISVYSDFSKPGLDENYPVGTLEDTTVEEVTGETYGPLKALCEQTAEAAMPGRVLHLRSGLIVGPHDPSDRFTYWPARVARGGRTLAPGRRDKPNQFIDARDLAEWNLRMIAANKTGIYNADGPAAPITMSQLLETCKTVSGSDADFVWMDDTFLLAHEVGPWMEVPLWVPDGGDEAGFGQGSLAKAQAVGLTYRPIADTVRDTLEWSSTRPADHVWRAGLSVEREAEILNLWDAKSSGIETQTAI